MVTLQRLSNGLYVVDFDLPPEEVEKAIAFLQREPSCKKLDTALKPTNLLLVFEQNENNSDESSRLYSIIASKVTPYRIPTPEYGDEMDGRLKSDAPYTGLGGSLSWAKVRCPRTAVETLRERITPDMRVGPTYWGRAGAVAWIYSKVRIPEPYASQQLQEAYTQITGDNSFRYLQVIQEVKMVE